MPTAHWRLHRNRLGSWSRGALKMETSVAADMGCRGQSIAGFSINTSVNYLVNNNHLANTANLRAGPAETAPRLQPLQNQEAPTF